MNQAPINETILIMCGLRRQDENRINKNPK
jgi:hypothetical protein